MVELCPPDAPGRGLQLDGGAALGGLVRRAQRLHLRPLVGGRGRGLGGGGGRGSGRGPVLAAVGQPAGDLHEVSLIVTVGLGNTGAPDKQSLNVFI